MAEEKMYKAALEAIDQGQTARARDLFTRLLKSDSSRAEYWLWMSTLVDTAQERIYCLESALRVDPANEAAKRGLVILGARPADKDVTPVPPVRRHWEKDLVEVAQPSVPIMKRIWGTPILRRASIILILVIVAGIIFAIFNRPPKPPEPLAVYKVSPFPTHTPTPSHTPTPTRTSLITPPTPVMLASTPLWMFLTETYTPVPLYVNTPHPQIEAYRAAIRDYEKADWSSMLSLMQQAISIESQAPDFYYYTGEAYRMMGNYNEAVIAYGEALQIDPRFAPAYLGRALAYEKIDPHSDIEGELSYALDYDPYYVDAYLARARIRILHNNPQGALDDLVLAESLFLNNPMVSVLRAQAYLEQNNLSAAMQNALAGYGLDKTSLPAYYTLALVYLANGKLDLAIHYINIYLVYVQDDARGFALKAQAEYNRGNYDLALAACEQGTAVDPENAPSWYYCGLIQLFLGDTGTAVNDFVNAVNLDMLNFDYSVALGKALWADQRLSTAIRQFNSAETLATTDYQRAVVYYNRAQIFEQDGDLTEALTDWTNLLALPPDQVPADWRALAQERWNYYNPPTATEIPTETPLPTETNVATSTVTPTITLTPTTIHPTPKRTLLYDEVTR